jgi:hypothetical protein
MVTLESKCWEGDWEVLLKTRYLEEQMARNTFAFTSRLLFINNVSDPDKVACHARRLIAAGVLTGYHLVESYANEALEFLGLSRQALGRGYVYSVAELVSIYLCRTPFLLHFSGDSILESRWPWVADALEELARNPLAVVANPTWNGCFDEARREAHGTTAQFYLGSGFSDQCYLIRTADFRLPIYGETHPLSKRYPAYGGELFEKRVDAWMRNHGRERLTHKYASYRHLSGAELRNYALGLSCT